MFILMLQGVKKNNTGPNCQNQILYFLLGLVLRTQNPAPKYAIAEVDHVCCRRLQGTYRPPGAIFRPPKFLPPPNCQLIPLAADLAFNGQLLVVCGSQSSKSQSAAVVSGRTLQDPPSLEPTGGDQAAQCPAAEAAASQALFRAGADESRRAPHALPRGLCKASFYVYFSFCRGIMDIENLEDVTPN